MLLVGMLLLFLAIRVPLMYRQPGGQDEDFYAFPGLTIVEDGLPRLPHIPQRDPASVFYMADRVLFAEPPLSFYWQAPFFAVLPPVYGTARLASAVAGLVAIWLVYELARALGLREPAALWAMGLYSLSRAFYFPATMARPDMLCATLGLGALCCLAHWQRRRSRSWIAGAGVLIGLGGLAHPFAIAYAMQSAAWVFSVCRGRGRLLLPLLLAIVAVSMFLLWLPLIATWPEIFRIQFFNNILRPAGPGFGTRLVLPFSALADHAVLLWGHFQPIQFLLLVGATGLLTCRDVWTRQWGAAAPWMLAWSSVYLLSASMGSHPAKGYWCYPAALMCLCAGRLISELQGRIRLADAHAGAWAFGAVLVAMMLPGAGLRTLATHIRNWNNVNYNAPAFARRIMDDLPDGARYAVDQQFVLDFYGAGRTTLLAYTNPQYLRGEEFAYDYLVVSRLGLDTRIAERFGGEPFRTYGERDDVFACYAEIYRPKRSESGAPPGGD